MNYYKEISNIKSQISFIERLMLILLTPADIATANDYAITKRYIQIKSNSEYFNFDNGYPGFIVRRFEYWDSDRIIIPIPDAVLKIVAELESKGMDIKVIT